MEKRMISAHAKLISYQIRTTQWDKKGRKNRQEKGGEK